MTETKAALAVGAEVVHCVSGFGGERFRRRDKVAKVYASGNVILESDPKQQYRPSYSGHYTQTGDHSRGWRDYIRPVTPELLTEIERAAAVDAAKQALNIEAERLHKLSRRDSVDDDALAECARLGLLAKVQP